MKTCTDYLNLNFQMLHRCKTMNCILYESLSVKYLTIGQLTKSHTSSSSGWFPWELPLLQSYSDAGRSAVFCWSGPQFLRFQPGTSLHQPGHPDRYTSTIIIGQSVIKTFKHFIEISPFSFSSFRL